MMLHNYEKYIYYHDTDAGGVVYYGRYLNFLEEARTAFLAARDVPVSLWHAQGIIFVVRECHLIYKKPAHYGDTIYCETILIKMTRVQIIMHQIIRMKDSNEILVEANVHLACLDHSFKPTAIPQDIKTKL